MYYVPYYKAYKIMYIEFLSSLTQLYITENTLMYPISEDENIHIPTETFFLYLIIFFSLAEYLAKLW